MDFQEKMTVGIIGAWIVSALVGLAATGVVIYVAWHFIQKVW